MGAQTRCRLPPRPAGSHGGTCHRRPTRVPGRPKRPRLHRRPRSPPRGGRAGWPRYQGGDRGVPARPGPEPGRCRRPPHSRRPRCRPGGNPDAIRYSISHRIRSTIGSHFPTSPQRAALARRSSRHRPGSPGQRRRAGAAIFLIHRYHSFNHFCRQQSGCLRSHRLRAMERRCGAGASCLDDRCVGRRRAGYRAEPWLTLILSP